MSEPSKLPKVPKIPKLLNPSNPFNPSKPSKPVVAHFIQDYLRSTTNWIHGQIMANLEYEPVVLAKRLMNPEQFKVKKIVSLENLASISKAFNRLVFRLLGYYPLYLKTCREMSVSIIHAHFGHIGFKALGLKRRLKIPLVTTFYGYDVSALGRVARYRRRFAKLFAEGELFLAEGPHLAACLEKLGCPAEKIRIFHLGVNIDQYRPAPRPEKALIQVLFAATLTDKKGWADALGAFQIVARKHANLRLRLIGNGEDEVKVERRLFELGIEKITSFTGYVPHVELLAEMQSADIFLQPSRTAQNGNTEGGAPVTLLDAQAMSLAICATTHADIPEVAPHGVSALLSPERDVQRLAENLARLVEDRALRIELGAKGRDRVETDYNWQLQGAKQAALYNSVLPAQK